MKETKVIANNNNKPLRIFEAFAGMGAQRKALSNNKDNFVVAGMAEWFVPAIISYQAIHNGLNANKIDLTETREKMEFYLESKTLSMDSKKPVRKGYWKTKHLDFLRIAYTAVKMSDLEGNIFDVTTLHKRGLKGIDLLTYSFPCQDLSQQGKQRGMTKGSGTRSGLLWEIEKALDVTLKKDLPKYLLMENVMALKSKKNAEELDLWLKKLESLGYKNDLQILNSAEFGSSQARRRTFMLSTLRKKVNLPIGDKEPKAIKAILDLQPTQADFIPALSEYDLSSFKLTTSNIKKCKLIDYTTFNSEAYVYDINFTGPTLTASGANSRIKVDFNNRIRKLNAREAYKYMGFTERDFNNVNSLNILTQEKMIYTCGNSISVEVLEAIMERICKNERQ